MNLPNRITCFRIVVTPLFFFLFLATLRFFPENRAAGLSLWMLFLLSEFSDFADGWIARRYGLVSEMGKLLDPFSDVLSRVTFFICFAHAEMMPIVPLTIIIWRELSMTFFRMYLLQSGGKALAAAWSGKLKAVLYFLALLSGMFSLFSPLSENGTALAASRVLFWCSAAASLISFLHYLGSYAAARSKK